MKKGISLLIICIVIMLQSCTTLHSQGPVVFVPEDIENRPYYYQRIIEQVNTLLDENATLRKQFYLLWMSEMMRGIQSEIEVEFDDLPE